MTTTTARPSTATPSTATISARTTARFGWLLPVGPLVLLAGQAIHPDEPSEGAALFAVLRDHRIAWYVAHFLMLAGIACFGPALVRLAATIRDTAPKLSVLGGPLPAAVDHRADGTEGPIKSQGLVGACTAFSLSSTMDNAVRRVNALRKTAAARVVRNGGLAAAFLAGQSAGADDIDKCHRRQRS